jgi:hypothetical protein
MQPDSSSDCAQAASGAIADIRNMRTSILLINALYVRLRHLYCIRIDRRLPAVSECGVNELNA